MLNIGFLDCEIRWVTIVSAILSFLGPVLIAFLLDRVALRKPFSYGKYLRILLTICLLLCGLFYGLLLLLPADGNVKAITKQNEVTFACNPEGAHIFQERCGDGKHCYNMEYRSGSLNLTNCVYTCQKPTQFENMHRPLSMESPQSQPVLEATTPSEASFESDYYGVETDYDEEPAPEALKVPKIIIEPPHVCQRKNLQSNLSESYLCHAFTDSRKFVEFHVESSANDLKGVNDSFSADWCRYRLDGFQCIIPEKQIDWMKFTRNNSECIPMIECNITHAYDNEKNFLSESLCYEVQEESILVPYFILRALGDLFALSVHLLLNIAIIVATRETSSGRGNVGHQLAWGAIGIIVFAIGLLLVHTNGATSAAYDHLIPMITFCVSVLIGALIVIIARKLPVTPTESWWHTKCGMLAYPMSAIKRYRSVIFGICSVAFLLGTLWNTMETIRQWYASTLLISDAEYLGEKTSYLLCVYITILAIPVVYNAERIIDFLGHSNIFIIAFVTYIIRFPLVLLEVMTPFAHLLEQFEPFSWYLPWIAFILFSRHLVPKRYLAIGQATLLVIFHAFSKALGTWLGSSCCTSNASKQEFLENNANILAIIACVVAIFYLILYHCVLYPNYRVPTEHLAPNDDDVDSSPQRVFHDERAKMGYFRY